MGKLLLVVFFGIICVGVSTAQSRRQGYPFLQLGIGPEVSWALNRPWTSDEEGAGFRHGLGAALALEYRLSPVVALVLQSGYRRWGTRQRIYADQNLVNERRSVLEIVPVEAGARFFPGYGNWFLKPLAGYGFSKGVLKDEQGLNDVKNAGALQLGLGLGKEWHNNRGVVEMSLQYDYSHKVGWRDFVKPFHTVKATVLLGFRTRPLRKLDNPCPKF